MFTGIIEEVGSVESVSPAGAGVAIRVAAPRMSSALREGESVSIDGACQTVVAADERGFGVEAVATTLGRTTLGDFRPGRRVNLERALTLGDRLGGHLVQGHVDGVGRVRSVVPRREHTLIDVAVPDEVAAITVLHGSLALNGVSLTVNALPAPGVVQLSIIPFTLEHTVLADLEAGDAVNLEADLIGKYVQRLVERSAPHLSGTAG